MIHLLCGGPGAGKTTLAHRLKEEKNAAHFNIDDRLKHKIPERIDPFFLMRFFPDYKQALTDILKEAQPILTSGRDVVLDVGALTRDVRKAIRQWAGEIGHPLTLHFIDTPKEIRFARIAERNAERGATYSFRVSVELAEIVESVFQPPTADEMPEIHDNSK